MSNYLDIVINCITEIEPYEDIDENTELIESGILDSLNIALLVTKLEEVLNIDIPIDELEEENFITIVHINEWINKLEI